MKTRIPKNALILASGLTFFLLLSYAVLGGDNVKKTTTSTIGSLPQKTGGTAKVEIIEFSDFQCPYCSRVVPTLKQIKENYGSDVEITFKQFPLSFHPDAKKAAEASECARDQGKFWEYHDKLFENQQRLKVDDLKRYAEEIGLARTFITCLERGEKAGIVEKNLAEGKSRGVTGTPSFFINDQLFVGAQPYEKFAEIIDVMIEVNSEDTSKTAETTPAVQSTPQNTGPREVQPRTAPAGGGSCGGRCGSPTCGASTGGSCGCGG